MSYSMTISFYVSVKPESFPETTNRILRQLWEYRNLYLAEYGPMNGRNRTKDMLRLSQRMTHTFLYWLDYCLLGVIGDLTVLPDAAPTAVYTFQDATDCGLADIDWSPVELFRNIYETFRENKNDIRTETLRAIGYDTDATDAEYDTALATYRQIVSLLNLEPWLYCSSHDVRTIPAMPLTFRMTPVRDEFQLSLLCSEQHRNQSTDGLSD